MKKIVVKGKTIEEAVKKGISELETDEEKVIVRVLEQPSKGLFGLIGAKEAVVELELKIDPVEQAMIFLDDMFAAMSAKVSVAKSETQDGTLLDLSGDELGMLIGRRGQTIDALQYLVNIVANRHSDSHIRIILDAENFRERRRKTLEQLSMRLANQVIRTRKEVILEPMSPQERKIIHSQLQEHPKVRTFSKGDEPNRRIVIALR